MLICIAVPCVETVHSWFANSLVAMVTKTLTEGVEVGGERTVPKIMTRIETGKLPSVRNRLLKAGIEAGADYMLWLDSDHAFPDWALTRLLRIDRDVVGINQPMRARPHYPTARDMAKARIYSSEAEAKAGKIDQVLQVGFAMVLVRMSIFPKLEAQARAEGRGSIYPMFDFVSTEDPDVTGGEDVFFCKRLHDAGIPIYLDHMLSWATHHIASVPLSMGDAAPE